MVSISTASVDVVTFPFSDLSGTKPRPAVVLTEARRDDWILCQITSNPQSDPNSIRLTDQSFDQGVLHVVGFASPTKLFTAHISLLSKRVAILKREVFKDILGATIGAFQKNMPMM